MASQPGALTGVLGTPASQLGFFELGVGVEYTTELYLLSPVVALDPTLEKVRALEPTLDGVTVLGNGQ